MPNRLSQHIWPRLCVLAWLPCSRLLLFLLILPISQAANDVSFLNLTIPLTSPQIIYTPFVCNATTVAANPQLCAGAWQTSDSTPPPTIAAATGPFDGSSNLIPQLFFEFRASALFLTTLPSSNATANIAIVSNGTSVSTTFNSSLGAATVVNLPQSDLSLFTITLVSSSDTTVFVLQSITLTALADIPITSLFPTATLPSAVSLPSFSTLSTTSTSSALPTVTSAVPSKAPSNKTKIAEAVGITVGLGIGLTAVAVVVFCFWNRRRRGTALERPQSEWRNARHP